MSKSGKLLLGVCSFLPILFMTIYIVVFFSVFLNVFRHMHDPDAMPELILRNIGWIIAYALLAGGSAIALKIYFIIHAVGNKIIDSTERIVWILIFIFAGIIGYPVYWYMRVWKEEPSPLR